MRRLLATLMLAAAVAQPAAAAESSSYLGECSFDSVAVTGDAFTGVAYGAFAVWSPSHGNVVTATVTCQVEVHGAAQPGSATSDSGAGVVAVGGPIAFVADEYATVRLCWTVDFTSDATPTRHDCAPDATTTEFPPQKWVDYVTYAFWLVGPVLYAPDAVVCGATGGDVHVADQFVWDCPPYEDPPPDGDPPFDPPPFYDPRHGAYGPTGGGYSTGDTGLLVLTTRETATTNPPALSSEQQRVAAACAFATAGDTIAVAGAVVAPGADTTSVRCRLLDAVDGTVLYDATDPAAVRDTIPATGRPITVCTTGTGDDTVVGEHCRSGVPR